MAAATQQLDDWLDSLGLGSYAPAFARNGIDLAVLPDLTDKDLEKVGLLLGHRRKLLRAIAALDTSARDAPKIHDEPAAERRQLTVMFADLVGSTALSTELDPEDLRRIYRSYRDASVQVVGRYDGHLAQFLGDGVMAYFGYPRAHEDDAERAVRAALDIIAAVDWLRIPGGGKIAARVGIATGLVVAGDLSTQEQAVVGETPNLAARLQGVAAPGTIAVADSTRRLLGEWFRLRPLGGVTVKGVARPVEAWMVEGEAHAQSRFEMVRAHRLTRFVGRDVEVGLLDQRWREACAGQGRVVQIIGEAGIGKSRFAARFTESIADQQPHAKLGCQCSPYHTASPFYPIIAHLKRAAGLEPGDPPERQLDKLEAMIALATQRVSEVAPLMAALLSLPSGDRYPPLGLSAIERRQQTIKALVDQLEGLARQQPVLLLFEDVHWADASTLEVLDLLVERVSKMPIMALITCRPDFPSRWARSAHVTTLTLSRLDHAQVRAMIDEVTGGKNPPDEVVAQIAAKSDGVPLFVEELTKTILESGLLVEEADGYRLDGPLPPLAIPATLQDSLMARLDRLAPVKEIAAIGALIGREFPHALLQAIVDRDPATLDAALGQLEEAELLFRVGAPPDLRYRFKHALIQDAAYESLLKSRRQILHRRVATTLCDRFPAIADREPEVIAYHYTQSALIEPAVEWWSRAGDGAAGRSAIAEATAHYGQAIALADTLPADPSRRQQRLRLQIAYAQTMVTARSPGAPETSAAFARARELGEEIGDPAEWLALRLGLWANSFVRGDVASARELANTFLSDSEQQPDSAEVGLRHRILGATACMEGDLISAKAHLEHAAAIYEALGDAHSHPGHRPEAGIVAMGHFAALLWQMGEVARARQVAEEVLRLAKASEHTLTIVYGHFYKSIFEAQRYESAHAASSAQALFDFSTEHLPQSGWLAGASFMLGWSRCLAGDSEAGLARMREAVAYFREQGSLTYPMLYRGILARTEAHAGQVDAALATLDEIFADSERTGLRWLLSDFHRLRGDILLLREQPDRAAAETAFNRALQIARHQQARSFELRAALGLARLYRTTGRADRIHGLLAPVLAALKEETELAEIGEARELLGDVGN